MSDWFREHVRLYRATDGEEGHIWREGATILLLTTTGRASRNETTVPLIYRVDGDNHIVVASNNGASVNPGWYLNLQENPQARIQVLADVFSVRARDADAGEYDRLWAFMNEIWPHYATYQAKTDRKIPVVVLERSSDF